MDKRVAKRHKRQVDRAKAKLRTSQPDVRTPEQIHAAKEAAKDVAGRGIGGKIAALFRKSPASAAEKSES